SMSGTVDMVETARGFIVPEYDEQADELRPAYPPDQPDADRVTVVEVSQSGETVIEEVTR
ncbi:MAG: hypothetical protein ABEK16_06315, partial [Candidatus Nanohalobium sp.]